MPESAEGVLPRGSHESRFKTILKSVGAKFARNREAASQSKPAEPTLLEPKIEQPQLPVVPEPTIVTPESDTRPKNIAAYIYGEIEKKGLKPPEYVEGGNSDFGSTNEKVEIDLLHKLRDQQQAPDGYLIGIGVSNIFSLLETYNEKNPPKGVVLVNVDPKAVEEARTLIDGLLSGTDSSTKATLTEEYEKLAFSGSAKNVETQIVIDHHMAMLKKLAQEGNIAVVQQDFLNPQVLEIIADLPQLKDSNNVIYLSNIADWIYRARYIKEITAGGNPFRKEDYAAFQNLHLLDTDPNHKNYFADSLQIGLNYRVRIGSSIPDYQAPQLDVEKYSNNLITLPRDQIEGPIVVTTSDLELRGVSLNELEDKYQGIMENPDYQKLLGVRNEMHKREPGYDHERKGIRDISAKLWNINRAKEKSGRGEELSPEEESFLEDDDGFTYGGSSKEEVEMAKIYTEFFWRLQAIDPQFDCAGKTAGEMMAILKSNSLQSL